VSFSSLDFVDHATSAEGTSWRFSSVSQSPAGLGART
jgi:hypothetical protein